jgi:hypothetical protein
MSNKRLLEIISAINLSAVSYLEHEHDEAVIFNFAHQPEIAHPVSPKFTETRTLQRLPDAARIV